MELLKFTIGLLLFVLACKMNDDSIEKIKAKSLFITKTLKVIVLFLRVFVIAFSGYLILLVAVEWIYPKWVSFVQEMLPWFIAAGISPFLIKSQEIIKG